MSKRTPDSPEGVALLLFDRIVKVDPTIVSHTEIQPAAATMLDLYALCLEATSGEREKRRNAVLDKLLGPRMREILQ